MKLDQAEHQQSARVGVLLINLGTPSAPTASAIRRYLKQFLSDPRVVEVPRLLWAMILRLFILPLRPRKLVHAYASVWTPAGSPLMDISRRQAAALSERLKHRHHDQVVVELAMSYGEPSVSSAMQRLQQQRVERIAVIPLYPQYSATTTAAAFDAIWKVLLRQRRVPALRTLDSYHDDPTYIAALSASVQQHWQQHGHGDHLLMSFHSIPLDYLHKGDPYFCFCHKTARLLAEALALKPDAWTLSFQSRIGNRPWLMPYTDVVVPQLAGSGVHQLDVICPGFAADCLETLEEVAQRYAEAFTAAGGEAMRYIAALNDRSEHIDLLERLASREIAGWVGEARQPVPLTCLLQAQAALGSPQRLAPSSDSTETAAQ